MKVPLSWLKKYISIDLTPVEIAKKLTMMGLEVDAIETCAPGFSNVVVGRVVESEKHPNADKLSVATVSDGESSYQVVCGAPNCRKGIVTAFAKIGALLPDEGEKNFKIKKSKIRGVESFGMLCTGKELTISDEDEGILEFGDDLPIGCDLSEYFSDVVFEISLTPNLCYCANIFGIARELHAVTGSPLTFPDCNVKEEGSKTTSEMVTVSIEEGELAPRYACRVVENISIAPSPRWMQQLLLASGIRPINNVVDITNYVLLETGQPLHAFDYDKIEGKEIVVKRAKELEQFTTLDEKERVLRHDDLMISDTAKHLAIAGVMGGKLAEVSETTKSIVIESAYFDASSIRRTSKRLSLLTEASRRFERGCDPNMVPIALDRAAQLMEELAGGIAAKGNIDIMATPFEEQKIGCRVSRTNALLGTSLSVGEIEEIFKRLGFLFSWDGDDCFEVSIPTYRVDISSEVDLIEEVARLYGYENLQGESPSYHVSDLPHSEVFLFEREIRKRMLSEGLQEFLTCDLIGPSLLNAVHGPVMSEESLVKVLNPTSVEQSCLRTSLLPGLLQVVKYNCDRQNHDIGGFEIGRVHFKEGEDKFREESVVAIILSGNNHPHHWSDKPRAADFYDLKGIVENMLEALGIKEISYKNNDLAHLHSGRQASIYCGELEIGTLGEIHPSITRKLDVKQRIYFAEFNLQDLYETKSKDVKMEKIPLYPSSDRDWTVTLRDAIPLDDLFQIIRSVDSPLLVRCDLRDVYQNKSLGEGIRNVTLRLTYRDMKKTVEQVTVDREHARITDKVRSLIG